MSSDCPDHEQEGFKECRWNPITRGWVSIYVASVAGIDRDPDQLYAVVCDSHGGQTSARSLTSAKIIAGDAISWCKGCQAQLVNEQKQHS